MRKKRVIYIVLGVFIGIISFLLLTNVLDTGDDEAPVMDESRWKAPPEADTLKNPFTYDPSTLREGKELYNIYCVSCHGPTGLGDGSPGKFKVEPANFHSEKVSDQSDGALFWKLTNGRGTSMPAYGEALPEETRWKLVSYIRQFSRQNAAPADIAQKRILLPSDYLFVAETRSAYFPIPKAPSNVSHSESQLFMVDTVVTGLDRPWSMAFLPDNTMLIAERSGRLLRVRNGKLQTPVGGNVPEGLRDIKLHPRFQQNKLIYLSYYTDPVEQKAGYTILMRGKLENDKLIEEEILYKAGPFKRNGEWYGSKIVFDQQGKLFFTVGLQSERKFAQDLSHYEGKTLRFNDDGSIPADNPFVNVPDALPEIYTYGHRMHEGLVCDPKTGRVLSTEFGELGGDELNDIQAGLNYGWPIVSHSLEYDGSIISESPFLEGMEPPIFHFAIAPSDADFVYSERYPAWDGNLFIGGLAAKMLYRVVLVDGEVEHDERLLENIGRVRDVKLAPDQLLYVMTEDTGIIVRLIPVERNEA